MIRIIWTILLLLNFVYVKAGVFNKSLSFANNNISLTNNSYSENNSGNISTLVNVSFLLGGKLTHRAIVFRSGPMIDASVMKTLTPNLRAGAGLAFASVQDELFVPVFVKINADFNRSLPTYSFSFKIGYSYAENNKYRNSELYSYNGGLFIEPGISYRFPVSESVIFNTGVKIISQSGMLTYDSRVISETYKERLSFLLLGVNFGIEL